MQDKRIDDKFINHAWEQMLVTLDQEMPTEQKRRRIVLIPWHWAAAASVLLLLTIGAGWWFVHKNALLSVADLNPIISTEKEAKENVAATESVPEAKAMEKPVSTTAHQPQQEKMSVADAQVPKHTTVTGNTNAIATSKALENQVVKKTVQQLASITTTKIEPLSQEQSAATNSPAVTQFEETTTPSATTAIENTALPTLSALQLALLEKEPVALEGKKSVQLWAPVQEEKKSASNWNIGVELATYASADAAVDGYAGGAVVDVPMANDKLNLRTGVNFNSQQRYFDSNIDVATEADRGFSPSTVIVDPSPNLRVNAQQLSLPLTLEFKPRKSWGLEGGLQASYLLGAQNLKGAEAYQTLAGFTNGNSDIRSFVSSLSTKNNSAPVTNADPMTDNSKVNLDAFRRFDVAVTAGFGVYPTKNLGVRLQYQRGLIDLLKADQFSTFGNNVRLSAMYFFGK